MCSVNTHNTGDDDLTAGVVFWQLPWESGAGTLHPDLVLAADVLYDPAVVPVLLRLLQGLLCGGRGTALLATRIRNEATLRGFVQQVPEYGLRVREARGEWSAVQFCHLAVLDDCRESIVFHTVTPQ